MEKREHLGQLVNAAVLKALNSIPAHLKATPVRQDLGLYIPYILQQYWFEYLYAASPWLTGDFKEGKIVSFKGIPVYPGYENKIILAHRDAVMYPVPILISETGFDFKLS